MASPFSSASSVNHSSPLNDWDTHTSILAISFVTPLLAFVILYLVFLFESRTEVRLARKFIMLNLGISISLLFSYGILGYYDIRNAIDALVLSYTAPLSSTNKGNVPGMIPLVRKENVVTPADILATPPFATSIGPLPVTLNNLAGQSITFPELRLVRPIIGLVCSILSLFINTHYVFRWSTVVLQSFLMVLEILVSSLYTVQLQCITEKICPLPYGYTLTDLYILWYRSYVTIALTIFLILSVILLMGIIGWRTIRYPIILFSIQRLSTITHKARGKVDDDEDTEVITGGKYRRYRTQGGGNLRTRIQAGVRIVWGATKDYFTRLISGNL